MGGNTVDLNDVTRRLNAIRKSVNDAIREKAVLEGKLAQLLLTLKTDFDVNTFDKAQELLAMEIAPHEKLAHNYRSKPGRFGLHHLE